MFCHIFSIFYEISVTKSLQEISLQESSSFFKSLQETSRVFKRLQESW